MSLPYFNMYPADFEADTSHLTLEEDGAYNRLLRLMWMTPGCSLPNDDSWIARRMRCDAETFARVVKPLISEFLAVENGRVFSPRLRREAMLSEQAHQRRVNAGSNGGRKPNQLKNNGSEPSIAKAMPKQPEPEPEPEPVSNSDTDVSGDAAEQDFAKQVFDRAVSFLGRYGAKEKDARSFVGRLRKTNSDSQIFEAFSACSKSGVVDPIPWLVAKLNRPKTDLDAAFDAAMQQMGPTQ